MLRVNIKFLFIVVFLFIGIFLGNLTAYSVGIVAKDQMCTSTPESDVAPEMEYVKICRTSNDCKNFSRLVMGTDHLMQDKWTGDRQTPQTAENTFAVLDEATRLGINFFDTAPIYVGGIENLLGQWRESRSLLIKADSFYFQKSSNPDRELYVLTKGGFPFDLFYRQSLPEGDHSPQLLVQLKMGHLLSLNMSSPLTSDVPLRNVPPGTYASRLYGSTEQIISRVTEEINHSLTNLHSITVYVMHRDDGDAISFNAVDRVPTPVETIMQALGSNALRSLFWMAGWSNWKEERVNQSLALSKRLSLQPIINSPYFSLFEMNANQSIHALGVQVTHNQMKDPHFEEGIKIMPYSPLGGFSILDQPEPRWENAQRAALKKFKENDPYWQNVYSAIFTPENKARWYRLEKFTDKLNQRYCTHYTLDQVMNAYVLAHPRTDLLAVGALTQEQIRRTVNSLKIVKKLTPGDLDYLYDGTGMPSIPLF